MRIYAYGFHVYWLFLSAHSEYAAACRLCVLAASLRLLRVLISHDQIDKSNPNFVPLLS